MAGYEVPFPQWETVFEVEHLRRERHELIGQLSVRCGIPGALTVNGYLLTGDFNFSSVRARKERAGLLAERAKTKDGPDWYGLLEQTCQKIFMEERTGEPMVKLKTLDRPQRGDEIRSYGLVFPRRHPSILFGDGSSCKSYLGLLIAGDLVRRGLRVALFDWELAGEDHRDRLERIYGSNMPDVYYCRCDRPLVVEIDRLRRHIKEQNIDYAIFDSVAFACDGRPEEAETAGKYFRSLRDLSCGSLHIAHITKSTEGSDAKPFGSVFFHNGARSTWYIQSVEEAPGMLKLGLYNRKSNLGPLHHPIGISVEFGDGWTHFQESDISDTPDLAGKMSIRQRLYSALRRGSVNVEVLADSIGEDKESIMRTARRYKDSFVVLDGGYLGLKARGV